MKLALLKKGFDVTHPLIVRKIPNDEENVMLIEGMHRYEAMTEIISEFGMDYFKERIAAEGIPCMVLKQETPDDLLVGLAGNANENNANFTKMSFVDSLFNYYKFVCEFAASQKVQWPTVEQQQVYQAFIALGLQMSWTVAQKKLGLIYSIVSKTDYDELQREPLAYRIASTKNSVLMEILLFDEMDHAALQRFRDLFQAQVEQTSLIAHYSEELSKKKFWKEATMYPTYLCRKEGGGAPARLKDYVDNTKTRRVDLLMRERFAIGYWMRNPKLSKTEATDMRNSIHEYVSKSVNCVSTYAAVLEIAEPNGLVGDALPFLAAKPKQINISALGAATETPAPAKDAMIELPCHTWPFPNYACFQLSMNELLFSQKEQAPHSDIVHHASLEDVLKWGGRFLIPESCESCANLEQRNAVTSYCAYHCALLCEECKHNDCQMELTALWTVDADAAGEVEAREPSYKLHLATIAVLGLLGPANVAFHYRDVFMQMWPLTKGSKPMAKKSLFGCHGTGISECKQSAQSMCTSCCRMLCMKCELAHKGSMCNLVDLEVLGDAWWLLARTRINTTAEGMPETLALIPEGTCVRQPTKVHQDRLRTAIARFITTVNFPKAAEYLRSKYLFPNMTKKARTQPAVETQIIRNTDVLVQQQKAQKVLRQWEIALPEGRRKAFQAACKFLTGDDTVEEQVAIASASRGVKYKNLMLPGDADEFARRESVIITTLYEDHLKKCELTRAGWQDISVDNMQVEKRAALIFCDPWYMKEYQPTTSDQPKMRKILDAYSQDGTVVLIFGRPKLLYTHWEPLFENNFASSKVKWHVDPCLFVVSRSSARDKHTQTLKGWHSTLEYVLTATRRSSKGKKDGSLLDTRKYTAEFKKKHGDCNGKRTTLYYDYMPPTFRQRLRNWNGVVLRRNAEKSVALNEYFVDLFTNKDDLVMDLFAGTASMAVACIKTGRDYFGTEIDEEVHRAAVYRIGKTWSAKKRGDFEACLTTAGFSRSLTEQVHNTKRNDKHINTVQNDCQTILTFLDWWIRVFVARQQHSHRERCAQSTAAVTRCRLQLWDFRACPVQC